MLPAQRLLSTGFTQFFERVVGFRRFQKRVARLMSSRVPSDIL